MLAELDGRVLPVLPIGGNKRPRCAGGCYGASADPAVVERLFANARGGGLGVATGAVSGIDVIDIDPRNGGAEWLVDSGRLVPMTRVHRTPRGGWHVVLRHVEGMGCPATLARQGVDVRGDGGYVVWPPTAGWTVAREVEVADWPEGLLALFAHGKEGSTHPPPSFSIEALRETLKAWPQTAKRWSEEESYAYAAWQNAWVRLSRMVDRRGSALYSEAAGLGELVANGWISAEHVVRMLFTACQYNGLVVKDGPHRVLRELFRGLQAGLGNPRPRLTYKKGGGVGTSYLHGDSGGKVRKVG